MINVGGGTDYQVNALACDGSGKLYAGGHFLTAGGVSAAHVAKWDGVAWSALGAGTDDFVQCMSYRNGGLYVAGQFTTAGGTSASNVAKWDGASWSAFGSGTQTSMNGNQAVLTVLSTGPSSLYVGGKFITAGGKESRYLAHWACNTVEVGSAPAPSRFGFAAPWPNPASRAVQIHFSLAASERVRVDVIDVTGRRVATPIPDRTLPAGEHHVTWDGRSDSGERVRPGVYKFACRRRRRFPCGDWSASSEAGPRCAPSWLPAKSDLAPERVAFRQFAN